MYVIIIVITTFLYDMMEKFQVAYHITAPSVFEAQILQGTTRVEDIPK